jgi:hypothetical protein
VATAPTAVAEEAATTLEKKYVFLLFATLKGIVSRDWKGLHIISLDRFEV